MYCFEHSIYLFFKILSIAIEIVRVKINFSGFILCNKGELRMFGDIILCKFWCRNSTTSVSRFIYRFGKFLQCVTKDWFNIGNWRKFVAFFEKKFNFYIVFFILKILRQIRVFSFIYIKFSRHISYLRTDCCYYENYT